MDPGTLRYLEGQVLHSVQFMGSTSYHIRKVQKIGSAPIYLFFQMITGVESFTVERILREGHNYECVPMCRDPRRQYIIDR